MRFVGIIIFGLAYFFNSGSFALAEGPEFNPQLGEKWDRITAGDSPLNENVFKLFFPQVDSYGTATYLGNFGGLDLFITAKHVSDIGCEILFLENTFLRTNYKVKCGQVIFSQENLDISIISASIGNPQIAQRLHSLLPAKLAMVPFGLRTLVQIVGYGSFQNEDQVMTEQNDDTCVSLTPYTPMLTKDPDSVNHPLTNPVWSLPIGCDSSPGDSGAPVFLRDERIIAGVLWTGGAHGSDLSNSDLVHIFEKSPARIWKDFSYVVPAPIIVSEIKKAVESQGSGLTSAARKSLTDVLLSQ